MSDERTIAPSPGRLRRAWRAGQRPWSPWVFPAVGLAVLSIAFDRMRSADELVLDVRPGALEPAGWLAEVSGWLGAGWLLAGLGLVAMGLLLRRVGAVSTRDAQGLGAAAVAPGFWLRLIVVALVLIGLGSAFDGVMAGAARGVDASTAGLSALWIGWAMKLCAGLALALGLAAGVDLLLDQRDRWTRLFQTQEQRRAHARATRSGTR